MNWSQFIITLVLLSVYINFSVFFLLLCMLWLPVCIHRLVSYGGNEFFSFLQCLWLQFKYSALKIQRIYCSIFVQQFWWLCKLSRIWYYKRFLGVKIKLPSIFVILYSNLHCILQWNLMDKLLFCGIAHGRAHMNWLLTLYLTLYTRMYKCFIEDILTQFE